MSISEEIRERLMELQDLEYKDFTANLTPSIDKENIIGVRVPLVRKLAAEYSKHPQIEEFIRVFPHQYYEENNLHGFLIERCKDYDRTISLLDAFLPYVDNWATCDMTRPKIFAKNKVRLLQRIPQWLSSNEIYTMRFGIEMLMNFYLDEDFHENHLSMVAEVVSDEYYVKMMVAWYFATALAKQWDATIPFLEKKKLPVWTHNKAIQKGVESNRISSEQKAYLRRLRIDTKREKEGIQQWKKSCPFRMD